MANKVRIGLDIGIGSIGWAVITGDPKDSKLENFGVRIFDSGELDSGKNRKVRNVGISVEPEDLCGGAILERNGLSAFNQHRFS